MLDQTCTNVALAVPGPFEGLCDLCVGDACCYDHRNWRTRAEVRIGRVDVFAQSAVLARRVYRLTSRPDTAPAAPLDGGIVAPRPAVPSWRLRAFERRLLSKDAQTAGVDAAGDSVLPPQWFESRDGIAAAVALSDPVIPGGARRPNHRVDPNASYFQTEPASPDDAFAADGTRRTYSLEVNVARVEFHLHADMSEEDFHAQALLRMYRDVLRRERAGLIDFHQRRVAALLTNLEAALSAASRLRRPGSERRFAELVRRRLAQVEREVVSAIELRDAAIREHVNGIAALQRHYAAVQSARQRQGYQATGIYLEMQRAPPRDTASRDADARLEERIAVVEEQVALYDADTTKVETFVADEARLKSALADATNDEAEVLRRTLASHQPPTFASFDAVAAVSRAKQPMARRWAATDPSSATTTRLPVDPHANGIAVVGDAPMGSAVPAAETRRRAALARRRYSARLIVDGAYRGLATEARSLEASGFAVDFGCTFSLRVEQWPTDLRLRIVERGLALETAVAEIQLRIPGEDGDDNRMLADPSPVAYDFIQAHGSRISQPWLQTDMNTAAVPHGAAFCRLSWIADEDGDDGSSVATHGSAANARTGDPEKAPSLAPPRVGVTPSGGRPASQRSATAAQLKRWLRDYPLDMANPRDVELARLLREYDGSPPPTSMGRDVHRLNTISGATLGEPKSRRALLIRRRWERFLRGAGDRIGLLEQAVPAGERDIDAFLAEAEASDNLMQLNTELDGVDAYSGEVLGQRRSLRDAMRSRIRRAIHDPRSAASVRSNKIVSFEDVVKDVQLPAITLDLQFLLDLLAPKRKLRPKRVTKRAQATHPDKLSILVSINKALFLPHRIQADESLPSPSPSNGRVLSTFVEITFQGKTRRTRIAHGNEPMWNEQIEIPFQPADGRYGPDSLRRSHEPLTLVVMDEVVYERGNDESVDARNDMEEGGQEFSAVNRQRIRKQFIGSTQITFGGIYRTGVIDGALRLDMPLVLSGYKQSRHHPVLVVHATISPLLKSPPPVPAARLSGGDQEDLIAHVKAWTERTSALKQCAGRRVVASALDTNGRHVLLPRYLAPVSAPPGLLDDIEGGPSGNRAMLEMLRFVSLIPYDDDASITGGLADDIFMTSSEFLSISSGDQEEHTLLLASMFLSVGIDAMVVMGASVWDADSNFVLTFGPAGTGALSPEGMPRVWNASRGWVKPIRDPQSQVTNVSVVFNASNVWANIQPTSDLWNLDMTFTNSTKWSALFADSAVPRIAPVQAPVAYSPLRREFYLDIEQRVEREVMETIRDVRRLKPTYMNRNCSLVLKKLAMELEQNHALVGLRERDMKPLEEVHAAALSKFQRSGVQMSSVQICKPFVKMESIREAVVNTGIAIDHGMDVEFSVGVHVRPYPHRFVCAIWVYIVALYRVDQPHNFSSPPPPQ